ncbi:MAG: methyltransferase domain-containing protein [Caldilineaceae bacterium]
MDRAFWNDAYKEDADSVMVADRILDVELADLPVGTALDLGCGRGSNALKLAAKGWSVIGVDWADHAIALATEAAKQRRLDAGFVVGDITTWQSPRLFDLVISTYALPGGEASAQALQRAIQALAPGGTLLVAEWDRSMAALWNFDPDELMTPAQIVALLPGLTIEKAEVIRIEDMFASPDDPRGGAGAKATIALVRARKN